MGRSKERLAAPGRAGEPRKADQVWTPIGSENKPTAFETQVRRMARRAKSRTVVIGLMADEGDQVSVKFHSEAARRHGLVHVFSHPGGWTAYWHPPFGDPLAIAHNVSFRSAFAAAMTKADQGASVVLFGTETR